MIADNPVLSSLLVIRSNNETMGGSDQRDITLSLIKVVYHWSRCSTLCFMIRTLAYT